MAAIKWSNFPIYGGAGSAPSTSASPGFRPSLRARRQLFQQHRYIAITQIGPAGPQAMNTVCAGSPTNAKPVLCNPLAWRWRQRGNAAPGNRFNESFRRSIALASSAFERRRSSSGHQAPGFKSGPWTTTIEQKCSYRRVSLQRQKMPAAQWREKLCRAVYWCICLLRTVATMAC